MKHILFTILICFLAGFTYAQHRIALKNNVIIVKATVNSLKNGYLTYEQEGSLHDIEVERIRWVEKETSDKWIIENNNWKPLFETAPKTDSIAVDTLKSNLPNQVLNNPQNNSAGNTTTPNQHVQQPTKNTNSVNYSGKTSEEVDRLKFKEGAEDARVYKNETFYFFLPYIMTLGSLFIPVLGAAFSGFILLLGLAAVVSVFSINARKIITKKLPFLKPKLESQAYISGFESKLMSKRIINLVVGFLSMIVVAFILALFLLSMAF